MKKFFAVVMTLMMIMTMLTITAVAESAVTIEIDIGSELGEDAILVFESILEDFEAETGIQVELVKNGDDHESVMKTRMASGNMPDMWSTHGWCVLRYGEYCLDLSDQSWVEDLEPSIVPILTNDDGEILGFPMTLWTYGIVYDVAIFEEAGIDASTLTTWDALTEACEKLVEIGITPFTVGCKGSAGPAGFLEMMNVFYSVEDSPYVDQEALLDGTFDFTSNTQLLEILAEYVDNGWFNEDVLTADDDTAVRYLGTGEYGMLLWGGPTSIATLNTYYPDREYGYIPTPAVSEDSSGAVTVGEGTSFAIWKDSENIDACLQLLEYLSDPEILYEFAVVNGGIPGLTTVEIPDSVGITAYFEGVESYTGSIEYTNFFDREWLPSGMWNAFAEAMGAIFEEVGSAADNVAEAAQILQDAYDDLL